ncbi:hemerythrin family protein [uncultured Desulfobulbus sp.]|uniref:bacteriohemerythrin n=1 Tax=uncultured Desulfobulbus sp. TaxID=239745 RepID=UPI0029C8142F|nr:hemerythrin family protein [uncultured Desulfobulbus sp.]
MSKHLGEWKECYELGIEDIDLQHHFFFNLINRLANELLQAKDVQFRMDLINELNAYAKFHFISEENMMRKYEYPDFLHHRNLHIELIGQLSTKENMLILVDENAEADAVILFLGEWFQDHTRNIDRKFADYLLEMETADCMQQPKEKSITTEN